MTVYFFESLNGLGKSTLICAFPENNVIKELFDTRQELMLTGKSRLDAIWNSSIELWKEYCDVKIPVLIDRGFLSEIVYSKALNRIYSRYDMTLLDRMWNKCDAKIIYLKRDFPIEIVLQRRPKFDKNFLLKIEKLYEKCLKETSLDVITFSVKPEYSSQMFDLLKRIIK